jgi:hypothetical protein
MEPTKTNDEKELLDLTGIFEELRNDAKSLSNDLLEGVTLWKSFGSLLLLIALIGIFLAYEAIFPQSLPITFVYVELLAALMVVAAGFIGYSYSLRKYLTLKKKYKSLFEIAQRLN